jgi:hypothetical protein
MIEYDVCTYQVEEEWRLAFLHLCSTVSFRRRYDVEFVSRLTKLHSPASLKGVTTADDESEIVRSQLRVVGRSIGVCVASRG